MKQKRKIILLCGKSGSGKSTVANLLKHYYNLKILDSYTTRPKRTPKEKGHIFVSEDEFDTLENICAYGEFAGYRYCATKEQVDSSDVYIIDPQGIKFFKEKYRGNKEPVVICISSPPIERFKRLIFRDGIFKGIKRWIQDIRHFSGINKIADYTINNMCGNALQCACVISYIYDRNNVRSIKGVVNRNK